MSAPYGLLFVIAFGIAQPIMTAIAALQIIWLFFAKEPIQFLAEFGASLALWLGDVAAFPSCATEDKPFPCRA